jgi:hypothetical protein
MGLIDFILNLAGLLLWLNWRAAKADPLGKPAPATLVGTLRRAVPVNPKRWHLPAVLGGLLLLRAVFYWQIGSVTNWVGTLDLGVTVLSFPSNLAGRLLSFLRICLFSFCSFGLTLIVFYLWLLLLSVLAGPEPFHALVRMQLGRIDRWPRWAKALLPLVFTALLWWLASWLFAWLHVIPRPVSAAHRLGESLVVALGSYLAWKYLIAALLALHLLNSYIYFGKHPFWKYVDATAQTLLRPLRAALGGVWRGLMVCLPGTSPWRTGKLNLSPALKPALASLLNVAGIALAFLLAELAGRGLFLIYGRLSL